MTETGVAAERRDTFELYRAPDAESAQIRGVHLRQLTRLTPVMMVANIVAASLLARALKTSAGWPLWAWWSALVGLAGSGLLAAWRRRGKRAAQASTRSFGRATWHAFALGLCWALAPALWFAGADAAHQVLIATLVAGMLSAGAFALAMLPRASLAYTAVITLGALVALWRDGDPLYLAVAVMLACYSLVVALGAMAMSRQATALLRARFEQARQQQVVSLLLRDFEENASDALWETDAEGRLVHSSTRLAALLGVDADRLGEMRLPDWFARQSPDARSLMAAWAMGRPFRDLLVQIGRGDGARWWALSAKPKRADEGGRWLGSGQASATGWRGVIADVTEAQRSEHQLRLHAEQDSLTGLANRRALLSRLQAALAAGRSGWLLSIDLDHFKAVNDSAGHSVGDEVLRVIGQRLRAEVGPEDLAARLGGDEFAVLRLHADGLAPQPFAQQLIAVLSEPIGLGVRRVHVGASVGLAALDAQARNIEELMVNADLALYDAKRAGRGRSVVYAQHLGELSRRHHAVELALREGLAAGQLELHYQPQVDACSLRPLGVEALMRWRHPVLGMIPPAEFVPAAERCGLIHELGELALRLASAAAGTLGGLPVAVNVSPLQLMDPGFVPCVERVLAAGGLQPGLLHLEVTESVMLEDAPGAFGRLHALRELGLQMALDDFGTGYSSLAHLRAFPFHTLKIDRSFVRAMGQHEDARAIVEMISQMATRLGMRTVAEGVETDDELALVRACGCHVVQGYRIARPMSHADLLAWLGEWAAERPAGVEPARGARPGVAQGPG